ncbi:MAG: cyclic nucleotide-binding domain-containing protein, partial [Rhodomicrobium sp.]|nr:cyclic nucleotide-binding domain-containing protein [Rhodomicrobium sp.]
PARIRGRHIEIPKNPLFASLSRQQLRLVLPHLKYRKCKHGRVLLQEGSKNPGKIYIVLDGQVAITKQGLSPLESRPADYELAVLRRSEIFGEVSFVDGKPSPVSFKAKTDITLAVVDLSGSRRRNTIRRVREVVAGKLRHHIAKQASESVILRMNSLQLENQLAAYRSGVGHLVMTTLCLLSLYILTLSFLPDFKSLAHANFALSPLIILLFALTFIPVIATSGFPGRFFGLQLDNWRPALALSLRASAVFLLALLAVKWVLISTSPSFAGVSLIGNADIQVSGKAVSSRSWYWLALALYLLLTPMQEFVARSGIQAPLYAFLHGSEAKRCWSSILASNLVFSAAHAHISLGFAIAAFLPGLLWGWLFAKTNSLLATTVSHVLVGGAALFLLGIEGVVTRLAT